MLNQYLYYLIDRKFQGVYRPFILSFVSFEDNIQRTGNKENFPLKVPTKQ